MRIVLTSAVVLAIVAGPALAQMDPLQLKYETERRERLETEKKYNETVRRTQTGTPEVKADPWRGVRQPETESKRKDRQSQ
jgi:hypothetical protein